MHDVQAETIYEYSESFLPLSYPRTFFYLKGIAC
jgi:hypothetical protein